MIVFCSSNNENVVFILFNRKESESIPVEVGGSGRGIRGKRDKNETPVGGIVVL